MRTIVGVDANHDSVTAAVSSHRTTRVYPHFVQQGYEVTRFMGPEAERTLVAAAAAQPDVVYLTGVGHGTFDQFGGHDDVPVFQIGRYAAAEVSAKIVHFIACLTARGLGPDFVTNGTLAYFGYDDNFAFDNKSRVPCLDCDSEIDRGFADGLTADDVFHRAYDAFTAQIQLAREHGKLLVAAMLENNRDHLCAPTVDPRFGDLEARIGARDSRET
jgi:hypothetical protein